MASSGVCSSSVKESVPRVSKDVQPPSATFIVSTGEPVHDDLTRRFIKSHVMRNSHRERRLQRFSMKKKNTPLPVESSQDAIPQRKAKPKQAEASSRTVFIDEQLYHDESVRRPETYAINRHIASHDPFKTLPVEYNDRTHTILHNSRAHTFRTSIYAGTEDFVLRLAGNSASLTWTVLCVEAYMQTFPYQSFVPESAAYMQNAIVCINNRLSEKPRTFDDATIAAVTHFSNFEWCCDAYRWIIYHGQLRGGLDSLGSNGILRRCVIWSDLLAATRFETLPKFPPASLSPAAQLPLQTFLPSSIVIPFLIPKPDIMTPLGKAGSLDILGISVLLHELCYFLNATSSLPNCDEVLLDAAYHDRVSASEYELLILLNRYPPDASGPDEISRILTLAGLLHIYTCLRLTRSAIGIRISLAGRMKVALENLTKPPSKIWRELLWVCFLGWSTCAPVCKDWYSMRVQQLCGLLGLNTWNDVSVMLRRGVHVESGVFESYRVLWDSTIVPQHEQT